MPTIEIQYPTDKPHIRDPDYPEAVAAIRKHGSARAAAEAIGASFKTMCRRRIACGLVETTVNVHPETADAFRRLTESQWNELESWCVDNAPDTLEE